MQSPMPVRFLRNEKPGFIPEPSLESSHRQARIGRRCTLHLFVYVFYVFFRRLSPFHPRPRVPSILTSGPIGRRETN